MSKCKTETVTIDRVVSKPEIPFHPTIPNVALDFDQAIGLPVGDKMAVFIPAYGICGPCTDRGDLLRSPKTMGAIINCAREVWVVGSEPTLGNAFGILVNTEKGKCVMSGQGTVSNEDGARGGRGSVMKFTVGTVYDNVGAQKRTVSGGGSVSDGGWEVHAEVTWTF